MQVKPIMRTLLAAVVLTALPASNYAFTPSRPSQLPQGQPPSQALQPGEANLAREVRHQLLLLPFYSIFDWFQFSVDGRTVTLTGYVVQPVLKSSAGNVVKHVEGVEAVVNNIKVLPLSDMDNQIRRAEARAIYGDPALSDRYGYQALPPIHIIVDNGHVTLMGFVANAMDKNIAGVRASSVANVFSVDNQLQVEQQSQGK